MKCGGSAAGPTVASGTAVAAASTETACTTTPEGEIGPYFTDDSASGYDRSTILANLDGSDVQTGVPLTLTITVVDTEKSCAPYSGAQVDIWHCNAVGIYSNESVEETSADSFLRGYQLTNASGVVQFTTIVPGWYAGRTTHIHLRVRSSYGEASSTSDGTNTTQLFFAQSLVDELSTSVSPYDTEGVNPTTNASDHVYAGETKGANLLTLSGSIANGFAAAITIGLPIS